MMPHTKETKDVLLNRLAVEKTATTKKNTQK